MSLLQVTEEYVRNLQLLSKKLHFLEEDPVAKVSAAYKDVEPEVEKLRLKAIYKVGVHACLQAGFKRDDASPTLVGIIRNVLHVPVPFVFIVNSQSWSCLILTS